MKKEHHFLNLITMIFAALTLMVLFISQPLHVLAEDNHEEHLAGPHAEHQLEVIPADWNHSLMNIRQAWADGYDGNGVKIAILDTGFHQHPDIDFAGGVSLFEDDEWTNDHTGHGTHVSGIIGAGQGTSYPGIAPGSSIYGVKIYHQDDVDAQGNAFTSTDHLTKGIIEAGELGADIIVISSGINKDDPELYKAIQNVTNAGKIVVAASGNATGQIQYPAAYDEVIAVSSIDAKMSPAADLTAGIENDFVAPGVNIGGLSVPDSPYGYPYVYMSGSSQAAPHIAGLIAILLQKNNFNTEKAIAELESNVLSLGDQTIYGKGIPSYRSNQIALSPVVTQTKEQDTPGNQAIEESKNEELASDDQVLPATVKSDHAKTSASQDIQETQPDKTIEFLGRQIETESFWTAVMILFFTAIMLVIIGVYGLRKYRYKNHH